MRKLLTENKTQEKCKMEGCNNLQMPGSLSKLGYKTYSSYCTSHNRKRYNRSINGKTYIEFRKSQCERCGFIPVHLCQLDVHHKDRNHKNNELYNLETLCANCHRLEHQNERDGKIIIKKA